MVTTNPPTKNCEHCGAVYSKPYTCGKPEWGRRRFCSPQCKQRSQVGIVPTTHGVRPMRENHFVPCRICGAPTKYHGKSLIGMVRCCKPECMKASKAIKASRNSVSQRRIIDKGLKAKSSWRGVPLISKEELLLEPWFREMGWSPQLKVLTKVSSVRLPRFARVDFGLERQKLYVEIDGTSHRFPERQERDARRDRLLEAQGWRGLRISASEVQTDPESAKQHIRQWLDYLT